MRTPPFSDETPDRRLPVTLLGGAHAAARTHLLRHILNRLGHLRFLIVHGSLDGDLLAKDEAGRRRIDRRLVRLAPSLFYRAEVIDELRFSASEERFDHAIVDAGDVPSLRSLVPAFDLPDLAGRRLRQVARVASTVVLVEPLHVLQCVPARDCGAPVERAVRTGRRDDAFGSAQVRSADVFVMWTDWRPSSEVMVRTRRAKLPTHVTVDPSSRLTDAEIGVILGHASAPSRSKWRRS